MIILFSLLQGAFLHFAPLWGRSDFFFSVAVDPAFRRTDAARRILRWYRGILWSSTFAVIYLFLVTGFQELLLVQFGGFLCAMTLAHRKALAHAVSNSTDARAVIEIDLAAPRESLPGGPLAALLPVASLAALALWASRHQDRLPSQIPVHWGLRGVDHWVAGVYGFLAVQAAISLCFVAVAWGILHWSRRVSADGANGGFDQRFRHLNVQLCLLISYLPAAQAWIALVKPDAMGSWWGAVPLLVIGIYIFRIRATGGSNSVPVDDRTPDRSWKLGIFYFNPADPSIFVSRRFGMGYTLNFGNRWSWAVSGVLIAVVVAKALLK